MLATLWQLASSTMSIAAPHDGQERGLVCQTCHDAIMGSYEERHGVRVFRG
ncbi:MAG TPA: hypothetical protein VGJ26_03820 [Pirellulales bacterium]